MLKVDKLHYAVRQKEILKGVSLEVNQGEFIGVLGPNGSGKSTLLKNIYKMLEPTSGTICLNDVNIRKISNRKFSQQISVVSQENEANFDFTVGEVVQMGRYPRKGLLETANQEDKEIVYASLSEVGMEKLMERSFLSLSGGEKQRVLIARALAQETDMIILDEPTNHLDVGSQMKTLNLLKESGKTILAALHDLSIAARYCDRIYVLQNGFVHSYGKIEDIITSNLVMDLYQIKAEVFKWNNRLFVNYN